MSKRKAFFLLTSLAFVAILVVMTAVLNLIVGQLPSNAARFDCTENGEYTLSEATAGILGRLKDILTVTYYVSKDLPGTVAAEAEEQFRFRISSAPGEILFQYFQSFPVQGECPELTVLFLIGNGFLYLAAAGRAILVTFA